MEVASTNNVYKGIKRYWNRRRGYEKLNSTGGQRKKSRRLGVVQVDISPTEPPSSKQKRRFNWRLKLTRRLKFSNFRRACSPKKLLIGLRDGYVNFMNRIANSGVANGISGGYGGAAENGFGMRTLKEYDEKMIIEIYKSIILAQGQLVPHRDAQKIGS